MRPSTTLAAAFFLFSPLSSFAQSTSTAPPPGSQMQASVPRLVKLSATLKSADGLARTVGVTFAIYKDEQGGAALWQEVQNVSLDAAGHYSVLLGSSTSEGLPLEAFASGEARWLGMRVEQEPEQPRTLLVAVPYALKAADAETLGGKPASSFVTTEQFGLEPAIAINRVQTSIVSGGTPLAANVTGSGSQNVIPKFDASGTNLINSLLFDDGTHIGVGTQSPSFQFDEQNSDTTAAGANTFRIQTPSVNGATMHFVSKSVNGHDFAFGSNFINGTGEFGIYDYTANLSRLLIDGSGKIGVGTSSPQFSFDLQNSDSTAAGSNIFRLRTPSVNGAVMHFQSTSANGHDYAFGSNFILGNGEFGIYDYTANTSRLFITAAGNVGIGNTAPQATLDLTGNLKVRTGGITFPDNTVQTTAATASGTITGVTAGTGLSGGGTTGTVTLSIPAGGVTNALLANNSLTVSAGTGLGGGGAVALGAATALALNTPARTRAITYLAGCDSCSVLSTADSQPNIFVNVVGSITITGVQCFSDQGTTSINLSLNGAAKFLNSDLGCTTGGASSGAISQASNLNDKLNFLITQADGTAHRVTVAITALVN